MPIWNFYELRTKTDSLFLSFLPLPPFLSLSLPRGKSTWKHMYIALEERREGRTSFSPPFESDIHMLSRRFSANWMADRQVGRFILYVRRSVSIEIKGKYVSRTPKKRTTVSWRLERPTIRQIGRDAFDKLFLPLFSSRLSHKMRFLQAVYIFNFIRLMWF